MQSWMDGGILLPRAHLTPKTMQIHHHPTHTNAHKQPLHSCPSMYLSYAAGCCQVTPSCTLSHIYGLILWETDPPLTTPQMCSLFCFEFQKVSLVTEYLSIATKTLRICVSPVCTTGIFLAHESQLLLIWDERQRSHCLGLANFQRTTDKHTHAHTHK